MIVVFWVGGGYGCYVPLVGSVGHKWTPNTPPGTTPLVSCSTRGRSLVFGVLAPGLPVVEAMQIVLAEKLIFLLQLSIDCFQLVSTV